VLTKKTSFEKLIHAACVISLTIGKIILLQHFYICSLTFWMSDLLWMHGAVVPFVPHLHATGYVLRWATFRKLESRMGKSGCPCTKLKNKQNVSWRHNLSSIICFLLHICLRWNKSLHCSVHLHCLFLIL